MTPTQPAPLGATPERVPPSRERLLIVPCSMSDAKIIVRRWHRHHPPPCSGLFALGVVDEAGTLRGVAIVGRPVARMSDDGWTCEVTRVATDGCFNACSALYGAAWKAARALGWRRMITYTLPSEGGSSLRGAGWRNVGEAGGGDGWLRHTRPGKCEHPIDVKTRWEVGEKGPDGKHPTRKLAEPVDDRRLSLFAGLT
jgi:hypothetical protein